MIESPCVKICTLETRSAVCLGCRRTLAEIARWSVMSACERARVMAELPGRHVAVPGGEGAGSAG